MALSSATSACIFSNVQTVNKEMFSSSSILFRGGVGGNCCIYFIFYQYYSNNLSCDLSVWNLFISRLKTQSCVNKKISSFRLQSSSK